VSLDDVRRSLSARTVIALGVAMTAAIIFLWLMGAVLEGEAPAADVAIMRWVREWSSPAADTVMEAFTRIGSYFVTGCIIGCVALWAFTHRAKALAWEVVAVYVAAITINALLKNSFDRPRPDLFPGVVLPETWSFPSGHSMVSLAAYGTAAFVIARMYPRYGWVAWLVVAMVVPPVGLSRVYLGVHWPSDVAAGFAAAAVLLIATRLAIGRRYEHARDEEQWEDSGTVGGLREESPPRRA
jgi:membrane-associated phospholipid phosphatase